jgi:pimeloyl-ACP methyl ester carboxylesterase
MTTTRVETIGSAKSIEMPLDGIVLHGDLSVPSNAIGLVLFAHGSGSSRLSPRNRAVAATLHEGRIATLLFDLLTHDEERVDTITSQHRFDIATLAGRLVAVTDWVATSSEIARLPVGYFGASTGAAAALVAAARLPDAVRAVVSRGGRPDLAGASLDEVRAPTLLIVGAADPEVLELNRLALARITGVCALEVVPGATHLFEEPGALERVAGLARRWFERYLAPPDTARGEQRQSGW